MTETSVQWTLCGISEELKGQEFLLNRPEMRLGRTPDNDLVVPGKNISRHHATFSIREGALWVQDLGSKNGTFVNEQRVAESPLHPQDVVRVAEFRFRVVGEPTSSQTSESPEPPLESPVPHAKAGRGSRRLVLYGLAALVAAFVLGSEFLPKISSRKKSPAPQPAATASSTEKLPTYLKATDDEVLSWSVRADAAMEFDDMAAAVSLLRKIAAARPENLPARARLARCEARLKSLIATYEGNGAREYEKLYYDKAIREWRKVLALSQQFDPNTYKRVKQRIHEAESKLAQKP